MQKHLQVVCTGASSGYSGGGVTFGNAFVTGQQMYQVDPGLLAHEYSHSLQWGFFGNLGFPLLYAGASCASGWTLCKNIFEITAGLTRGGITIAEGRRQFRGGGNG